MIKSCRQWCGAAALLAAFVASPAFAQGTSSITGTVTDSTGGVIPGATVTVTGVAGVPFTAITNSEGVFTVPALGAGTYRVSVALQGFKTAVLEKVQVALGSPTNVSVKLELGQLSEQVKVSSSSELINTQTATVTTTLNADQLNRMPTVSRNALNAVTFLPGVNTATSNRASTVNGLPESMINITLDGVSNQDNFLKSSDGFFASVYPRQDAVEQVTVTLAAGELTSGGSGAVNIAFTTRSGTNRLAGSAYEYFRNTNLNTNYFFNEANGLPRNEVKVNQYGARVGGPIKIPGLYDGSGKAFYFFHYEELRFPNSFTRTRTVFSDGILNGEFLYGNEANPSRVNLINIATAAGQTNTFDPQIRQMLTMISNAAQTTGVFNTTGNPMIRSYIWQSPGTLLERQPTGKVDYNFTSRHRLTASASSLWAKRDPDYLNGADARFPGAPNYRVFASTRPLYSFALRSTLSANMVNEVTAGLTALGGGGSRFGQPTDPSHGVGSFADIGGYAIGMPTNSAGNAMATTWWTSNSPSWRAAPTYNLGTNLSWQKSKHALSIGGGWLRSSAWENAQQITTAISIGMVTAFDPAAGMFNTTNFPGASNADLTNARAVYSLMTGRVSAVNNQAALSADTNQYVMNGPRRREGYLDVYSLFLQDQWRVKPTVTISGGARWDLQTPFQSVNDTMAAVTFDSVCGMSGRGPATTPFNKCAFFTRTANSNVVPEFVQLKRGTHGFETDWNNVSPSISIAWRPNVQSGFLRAILGDPEQATLRAGFSQTYSRQGIAVFTDLYGDNPGSTISANRNNGNGLLVNTTAGETWPLLYRDKARLYPATFPVTQTFPTPINANRGSDLNAFAEDTQIDSARTWSIGFQRAITRDMAVDIRYVGTRGVDQWSTLDYNARDILTNGFLDEFKLAVGNLKANNAAGRGASFAYFGPGSGTNPLPVYMAYLIGPNGNPNNPASYTGNNWTSTTFTNDLIFLNPNAGNAASDLDGSATFRANAIAAGLPANYFVLNPLVDENNVTDSGAFSDYHALQIEVRRRLSRGLSATGSYQYAREGGSAFDGFLFGRTMVPSANVRHAIKTQWDWTLPVGRGQRYGTDMGAWLDGVLGGWSFKGVGRVQARVLNFGNVRLVGMTRDELQAMYKYHIVENATAPFKTIFMLPEDVRQNTRAAFSLSSSTVNGYSANLGAPTGRYIAPANSESCMQIRAGDCAPRTLLIRAPFFVRFDVGLSKRFALRGASSVELSFEMLNLLDNINFNPTANPGTGADIFRVTSAYTDPSNTYDPGGRLGQVMFRINW
jgi:hypothetical protein